MTDSESPVSEHDAAALIPTVGTTACSALLTLPNAIAGRGAGPRWLNAVRGLLDALPDMSTLMVAGHADALRTVMSWPEAAGRAVPIVTVPDAVDFSVWCQDAFLACRNEDGSPLMLLPARDRRRANAMVIEAVAVAAGIDVRRASFDVEGGNLLVGDGGVLLGADERPADAMRHLADRLAPLAPARRVALLATETDLPRREIRLLATANGYLAEEIFGHTGRRQPLFHLDIYATPTGRMIGDRELVLVGDSRMASAAIGGGALPLCDQSVADALDEIAEQIASTGGFAVQRNPMPIIPITDGGLKTWTRTSLARKFAGVPGIDDVLSQLDRRGLKKVPLRRWRAASQNNCLVLGNGGRNIVLLPTYGHGRHAYLAAAERQNRLQWESLGFEVRELPDYTGFAAENGSLHCMFKLLPSVGSGHDREADATTTSR